MLWASLLEGVNRVLLLGLHGDVKSTSSVDVPLVLAGASLEEELADPSVAVLGGQVERGGSGGEGLGGRHGTVVQEELANLVVTVPAGVVESGPSDVVDLVDVTGHEGDDAKSEKIDFVSVTHAGITPV